MSMVFQKETNNLVISKCSKYDVCSRWEKGGPQETGKTTEVARISFVYPLPNADKGGRGSKIRKLHRRHMCMVPLEDERERAALEFG